MKLLLILLLPILMFASNSQAGNIADVGFFGIRYDFDAPATIFHAGIGKEIGINLWSFSLLDIGGGEPDDVSTEVAYIRGIGDFGVGILGGAAADWETEEDVKNTYLVGLAGFIVTYSFSDTAGLWGYTKYKFSFQGDDVYPDGTVFGGGIYFDL